MYNFIFKRNVSRPLKQISLMDSSEKEVVDISMPILVCARIVYTSAKESMNFSK